MLKNTDRNGRRSSVAGSPKRLNICLEHPRLANAETLVESLTMAIQIVQALTAQLHRQQPPAHPHPQGKDQGAIILHLIEIPTSVISVVISHAKVQISSETGKDKTVKKICTQSKELFDYVQTCYFLCSPVKESCIIRTYACPSRCAGRWSCRHRRLSLACVSWSRNRPRGLR